MVEIRRLPEDATLKKVIHAVNRALDLQLGNIGGRHRFINDDGVKRNIRGGATITSGHHAVEIRSGAGLHLFIRNAADTNTLFRVTDASGVEQNTDLQILGAARRIKGDFSAATVSDRTLFQSIAVNVPTSVGAIPTGTGTTADWTAYNNAAPGSASAAAVLRATTSAVQLRADSPSGSYQPLELYTNNTLQGSINASGHWAIATASGRLGFFGTTPIVQPSALIQTYATAARTLAAYTPDVENAAYTGLATGVVGTPYASVLDLNNLRLAVENLRVHHESLAQFHNAHVDDHQLMGLVL